MNTAKESPCVEWTKCKNAAGYGRAWHNGALHLAHRLAYCMSDEQWYDLAQRHANADWNSNGYLDAIKAVCADYVAIATPTPQADAAIAAGGAQEPVATRAEIEHARDRVLAQSKNSLFRSGAKICAAEILSPTKPCTNPPEGWTCSRVEGHEGPCAASPTSSNGEQA